MPFSNIGLRLVRQAFSEEEWALLSRYPEFLKAVEKVISIDDADGVIRAGAEIVEKAANDPGEKAKERPRSPPSRPQGGALSA